MRPLFVATLISVSVLAGPATAAPDYTATVTRIVDTHAKPAYQHLAASTADLAKTLAETCGKAGSGAAARDAFNKAVDNWQAIQHIRSGPASASDRHARIMFWPDERAIGSRQLSRFLA